MTDNERDEAEESTEGHDITIFWSCIAAVFVGLCFYAWLTS